MKNGQSKEIGNIWYTRHKPRKTKNKNKKQKQNTHTTQ